MILIMGGSMNIWLEWIGAILCIIAQLQRSLNPKWILLSFITSSIASLILGAYLLITKQYGLLLVEIVFVITNIIGYNKWKRLK